MKVEDDELSISLQLSDQRGESKSTGYLWMGMKSPLPFVAGKQPSAPPSLATSTTQAFPSHHRLALYPESTPAPFHQAFLVDQGRRRKGNKSPGIDRHDERIVLRSGWDTTGTSLGLSTDLCSTTSSIRTTPQKIRPFFASCGRGRVGLPGRTGSGRSPPLCPQIRASQRQLIPDGPFRTSRDKTVSPRRPSPLLLEVQLVQVANVCGSRAVSRFRGCALRRHRQVEALESMHHTAL